MTTETRKIKRDHGGSRGEEEHRGAQGFLERGTVGHSHYEGESGKMGQGGRRRAVPKKWEGGTIHNTKDAGKSYRE